MNASATAVKTAAIPMLKKITPKTVTDRIGLNLLKLRELDGGKVKARVLYDLYGVVTNVKTGATTLGDWVKFQGRFRAVVTDQKTGEITAMFESPAAHIPNLEDMLHAHMLEAKAVDPRARAEVAFRIGIVPAPDGKPSATGYEYDVQRLVDVKNDDDPIVRLMNEASNANKPALPAPGTTSADKPPIEGAASTVTAETPPPPAANASHKGHGARK